MIGAVIGDVIGSSYEWERTKDYNFELFRENSDFTDDTILTMGTAHTLMYGVPYLSSYKTFGNKY